MLFRGEYYILAVRLSLVGLAACITVRQFCKLKIEFNLKTQRNAHSQSHAEWLSRGMVVGQEMLRMRISHIIGPNTFKSLVDSPFLP